MPNAGVLSGVVGSVIAIPLTLDPLANFPWDLDPGLLGLFVALLTSASPLFLNSARYFRNEAGGRRTPVNWIAVFLFSAIESIAGAATLGQMVWYANQDLVKSKMLTTRIGDGIEWTLWTLWMFAGAFTIYFFNSIRLTVFSQLPKQPSPIGNPPPTDSDVNPTILEVTRWSLL